jgi:hypothetical protein
MADKGSGLTDTMSWKMSLVMPLVTQYAPATAVSLMFSSEDKFDVVV